jgi:hypothetical protein
MGIHGPQSLKYFLGEGWDLTVVESFNFKTLLDNRKTETVDNDQKPSKNRIHMSDMVFMQENFYALSFLILCFYVNAKIIDRRTELYLSSKRFMLLALTL